MGYGHAFEGEVGHTYHRRRRIGRNGAESAPTVPNKVLALQRRVGNAALSRVLEERRMAQAHRTEVQRSAVHEVLRHAGRPLAEPVRAEMESRLGADFGDVRIHTGAAAHDAASAVQAEAFTAGRHVVFGRGRYDPRSASGRQMIAHELTHVVQQRSGPVAGTDRGDGVSVSHPSDRFERAAEATARSAMLGPTPVQRAATAIAEGGQARDAGGQAVSVQRNVGLEIEDSNWKQSGEDGKPLPKKAPLVHRNYFQLQAESPDHVELVTDAPGVANRGDYEQMKASMVRLEKQLISQQYRVGMDGKASRFRADRLEGGVHNAFLRPGWRWAPHLQVTAGVPLAGIPKFFQLLQDARVSVQLREADQIEQKLKDLLQLPAQTGPEYRAPSRELLGFTQLLNHYLYAGASKADAQFAKAVFAVMARTDFAASFEFLDPEERGAIKAHLAEWVRLMVESFAYNPTAKTHRPPDGPVLDFPIREAFSRAGPTRAGRVDTSRDGWLRGMVEGYDLLSTHGRNEAPARGDDERARLGGDVRVEHATNAWRPAVDESLTDLRQLMEGLGELRDKYDTVTYQDSRTDEKRVQAIIVEVRRLPDVRPGAGGWIASADDVYNAVEAAVEEAGAGAAVVPAPSVRPNPAIPQDTRAKAIARRARNSAQDLALKARKLALRR